MSGTLWIVALWTIAIVSAALSFLVWFRLTHVPGSDRLGMDDASEEAEAESDEEPSSGAEEGAEAEEADVTNAEELDSDQPVR